VDWGQAAYLLEVDHDTKDGLVAVLSCLRVDHLEVRHSYQEVVLGSLDGLVEDLERFLEEAHLVILRLARDSKVEMVRGRHHLVLVSVPCFGFVSRWHRFGEQLLTLHLRLCWLKYLGLFGAP